MAQMTFEKYRHMSCRNHGLMAGILRAIRYENGIPNWLNTAAADAIADYDLLQNEARIQAESRMIENEG